MAYGVTSQSRCDIMTSLGVIKGIWGQTGYKMHDVEGA